MPNSPKDRLEVISAPISGGLTPSPLFSRFGVAALIIGMVIAFFISQLIGVYGAGKLLLPSDKSLSLGDLFYFGSSDGTIVSLSVIVSCVLIALLIIVIIRLKKADLRQYLALKPFSWALGIGMFSLLLIFMVASQALTYWLDKSPSDFVDPLYQSVSSVGLLVFALVIVAPIYEELVFRGILWQAISEQFTKSNLESQPKGHPQQKPTVKGALIASILTSLIFAVIHLQYGIYEISTIVLLALIFCYARYKSASLLLPILLHIINNGAAMWLYLSQVS